jgi:TonB family protein
MDMAHHSKRRAGLNLGPGNGDKCETGRASTAVSACAEVSMRLFAPMFAVAISVLPAVPAAAQPAIVLRCQGGDGVTHTQSIDACTAILQAGGGSAASRGMVYVMRARHHYLNQAFDRAIADLDMAVKLNPKYPQAFHYRGLTYASKHDFDRAIADFDRVIKLDPKFASGYFRRGLAYYLKDNFDRAIADLDQSIKLDPDDPEVFHYRALAWAKKGDPARAIADYDETIKRDPKNALAFYNRGNSYAKRGDRARAIADFDQAIRLDASDAKFFYNRGRLYAGEHPDLAIADFSSAIRIDPQFLPPYVNRGDAYRAKGELDAAIADYDRALQIAPGEHGALLGRSAAHAAKGDHARAREDYGAVVAAILRSAMSYPRDAKTRREEGVVRVTFQLDHKGNVVASGIAESSGNALLDREALAMIQRAQPFPASPWGGDDTVDFATAIRFSLR